MTFQVYLHQKGRWQVLSVGLVFSRVLHQAKYYFGDPTLAKLDQVKLLCETKFCSTKYILLYDPVVHTGTTFLLTSKTLPHKPKMYLQDKHYTTPNEVQ